MKTAIIAIVALAAAAGAAAAEPAAVAPAPTVSVAYADLDLNTDKGAAAMLTRIRRAAADACRQSPSFVGNDADTILRLHDCTHEATARAVAGLGAAKVTLAYGGEAGGPRLARLP